MRTEVVMVVNVKDMVSGMCLKMKAYVPLKHWLHSAILDSVISEKATVIHCYCKTDKLQYVTIICNSLCVLY
jgi:hypothetical protein